MSRRHSPRAWTAPKAMSTPTNSCTPRKCLLSGLVARSIAPASGGPSKFAILDTLCAMPSLVPSTFGSGHTTGKTLGGRGTSGPEKAPTPCQRRTVINQGGLTVDCAECDETAIAVHTNPSKTYDTRDQGASKPCSHDTKVVCNDSCKHTSRD